MESNPRTFRAAVRRWFRKLGTALLPWAVVGCAATLTLTAGGSSERLAYVKTLIWPVVTVVVVWSLRDLLRTKFGQVEQLDALGVAVKFQVDRQADERLQDGVREAVAELDAANEPVEARAIEAEGNASNEELERAAAESESRRREAIEKLIRDAAAWGYSFAGRPEPSPEPRISWNENGEPEILPFVSGWGQLDLDSVSLLTDALVRATARHSPSSVQSWNVADKLSRVKIGPTHSG